jgi:uncharacterized protein (UPF0335 family)
MRLDEQYEQAKHSLRRTKPSSKRRTVIERNSSPYPDQTDQAGTQGEVEMSETAEIGHNSNAAAEQLLSIIKRVETMEEQKKATIEDIKDIYQEAASSGFDVPALKAIVRARRETAEQKAKREEREAHEELYRSNLGMLG